MAKSIKFKKYIPTLVVLLAIGIIGFIIFKLFFASDKDIKFNTDILSKSDPSQVERSIDKTEKMTVVCENDKLKMQYDYESDLIVITDKATGTIFRSYPELTDEENQLLQKGKEAISLLTSPLIIRYTTTSKDDQDRGINQVLADYSVKSPATGTKSASASATASGTSSKTALNTSATTAIASASATGAASPSAAQSSSASAKASATASKAQITATSSRTSVPQKTILQSEKIANIIKNNGGLQLIYKIPSLGFEITAEFTLQDNAVVSFIPSNGLKESNEDSRLMSIIALPYFGAARQGDKGYFVSPDGSGAITKFDEPRITRDIAYEKQVYGPDMTFSDLTQNPEYSEMNVTMPVIGTIKKGIMLSSFAVTSEEKASIVLANPGNRSLPFYRSGFMFTLRNDYYIRLSKSSEPFRKTEKNKSAGDLKVITYINVDKNKDFNYVNVAQKTKEVLLQNWKDKYGIDKKMSDEYDTSYMNIKVFLGAENRWSSTINGVKVMTTFNEVQEIYNKLKENGVKNVRISVLGWMDNGYFANATDKFNPESAFGGAKDFEKLIAWAKSEGIELSIENNDIELYGKPEHGISLRSSTVRRPGTEYMQFKYPTAAGVYRQGTDFYILNPLYFKKNFMNKDIDKIKSYGVESIDLTTYGDKLFTDYNMSNPLLRKESLNLYMDILKKYDSSFKNVSVYYGNDYAASVADKILDIPLNKSYNPMLDEAVPFIQIVYHGLLNYYSDPINSDDHPRTAFLKAIEYGALPSYELTYRRTDQLKYTYYDKLFSSDYITWLNDVTTSYNSVVNDLVDLRNQTITNHYKVLADKKVYCTEYSNGTKIYVNYEDAKVSVQNIEIEALSYLKVVEGR